jgi:hypothetical protein
MEFGRVVLLMQQWFKENHMEQTLKAFEAER